jgi:hypothetical protein
MANTANIYQYEKQQEGQSLDILVSDAWKVLNPYPPTYTVTRASEKRYMSAITVAVITEHRATIGSVKKRRSGSQSDVRTNFDQVGRHASPSTERPSKSVCFAMAFTFWRRT